MSAERCIDAHHYDGLLLMALPPSSDDDDDLSSPSLDRLTNTSTSKPECNTAKRYTHIVST
jgi:hypothetical protein